jgi:hypothetical protein
MDINSTDSLRVSAFWVAMDAPSLLERGSAWPYNPGVPLLVSVASWARRVGMGLQFRPWPRGQEPVKLACRNYA